MVQDYRKAVDGIREFSHDYFKKHNLKSIVIGLSGGIDSACCVALLDPVCRDLGMEVIGRSYPISTNKPDEIDRAQKCSVFCTDFKEVNLANCFLDMEEHLELDEGTDVHLDAFSRAVACGNRKARLRMIRLYDLAGKRKGVVISTDNYTELLLGFWTLHGDVGDFGPIQMLWKTEVYKLSEYMASSLEREFLKSSTDERVVHSLRAKVTALRSCVEAIPTDGLGITNSDLDQLLPDWNKTYANTRDAYEAVDLILQAHSDLGHSVMLRHQATEFKRKLPISIPRLQITADAHVAN
jgi:NAD+ synthase